MKIDYNSLLNYLKSQDLDGDTTTGAIPFKPGKGSMTAQWGINNEGKRAIVINGNIDYSIYDTSAEIPIDLYINYGVYGVK